MTTESGGRKKKQRSDPKCRGCRRHRSRGDSVKIGGSYYHPDCAEAKPKMRQRWETGLGWVRL